METWLTCFSLHLDFRLQSETFSSSRSSGTCVNVRFSRAPKPVLALKATDECCTESAYQTTLDGDMLWVVCWLAEVDVSMLAIREVHRASGVEKVDCFWPNLFFFPLH